MATGQDCIHTHALIIAHLALWEDVTAARLFLLHQQLLHTAVDLLLIQALDRSHLVVPLNHHLIMHLHKLGGLEVLQLSLQNASPDHCVPLSHPGSVQVLCPNTRQQIHVNIILDNKNKRGFCSRPAVSPAVIFEEAPNAFMDYLINFLSPIRHANVSSRSFRSLSNANHHEQ